jgi:hypothetical protein
LQPSYLARQANLPITWTDDRFPAMQLSVCADFLRSYRTNDILLGLKRLIERESVISARLTSDDPDLPWAATVAHHFGKLSNAYQLFGLVRLKGKPVRFGLPRRK